MPAFLNGGSCSQSASHGIDEWNCCRDCRGYCDADSTCDEHDIYYNQAITFTYCGSDFSCSASEKSAYLNRSIQGLDIYCSDCPDDIPSGFGSAGYYPCGDGTCASGEESWCYNDCGYPSGSY